jgi:hypothetical protein
MFPLQAIAEPAAMGVVVLSVVMVFVILFGFIWAFGKLETGAEVDEELEEPGRPRV